MRPVRAPFTCSGAADPGRSGSPVMPHPHSSNSQCDCPGAIIGVPGAAPHRHYTVSFPATIVEGVTTHEPSARDRFAGIDFCLAAGRGVWVPPFHWQGPGGPSCRAAPAGGRSCGTGAIGAGRAAGGGTALGCRGCVGQAIAPPPRTMSGLPIGHRAWWDWLGTGGPRHTPIRLPTGMLGIPDPSG